MLKKKFTPVKNYYFWNVIYLAVLHWFVTLSNILLLHFSYPTVLLVCFSVCKVSDTFEAVYSPLLLQRKLVIVELRQGMLEKKLENR